MTIDTVFTALGVLVAVVVIVMLIVDERAHWRRVQGRGGRNAKPQA